MGRFYNTSKFNPIDFMSELPIDMMLKATNVADTAINKQENTIELFKNKVLEVNGHEKDKNRLSEIKNEYENRLNELATTIQKDSVNWRKNMLTIRQMTNQFTNDMTKGELYHIQKNYNQKLENIKDAEEKFKKGDITQSQYLKMINYQDDNFEGTNYNKDLNTANTFSSEKINKYVDLQDRFKKYFERVKPVKVTNKQDKNYGLLKVTIDNKDEYITPQRLLEISKDNLGGDMVTKEFLQQSFRTGFMIPDDYESSLKGAINIYAYHNQDHESSNNGDAVAMHNANVANDWKKMYVARKWKEEDDKAKEGRDYEKQLRAERKAGIMKKIDLLKASDKPEDKAEAQRLTDELIQEDLNTPNSAANISGKLKTTATGTVSIQNIEKKWEDNTNLLLTDPSKLDVNGKKNYNNQLNEFNGLVKVIKQKFPALASVTITPQLVQQMMSKEHEEGLLGNTKHGKDKSVGIWDLIKASSPHSLSEAFIPSTNFGKRSMKVNAELDKKSYPTILNTLRKEIKNYYTELSATSKILPSEKLNESSSKLLEDYITTNGNIKMYSTGKDVTNLQYKIIPNTTQLLRATSDISDNTYSAQAMGKDGKQHLVSFTLDNNNIATEQLKNKIYNLNKWSNDEYDSDFGTQKSLLHHNLTELTKSNKNEIVINVQSYTPKGVSDVKPISIKTNNNGYYNIKLNGQDYPGLSIEDILEIMKKQNIKIID